jgi:hypothetical protein
MVLLVSPKPFGTIRELAKRMAEWFARTNPVLLTLMFLPVAKNVRPTDAAANMQSVGLGPIGSELLFAVAPNDHTRPYLPVTKMRLLVPGYPVVGVDLQNTA